MSVLISLRLVPCHTARAIVRSASAASCSAACSAGCATARAVLFPAALACDSATSAFACHIDARLRCGRSSIPRARSRACLQATLEAGCRRLRVLLAPPPPVTILLRLLVLILLLLLPFLVIVDDASLQFYPMCSHRRGSARARCARRARRGVQPHRLRMRGRQ
jgi:hypothetical protein